MREKWAILPLALFELLGACGSHSQQSARAVEQALDATRRAETQDRDAGFAYAKKLGVIDPAACGNGSPAFREGCKTWVSVQLRSTIPADSAQANDSSN